MTGPSYRRFLSPRLELTAGIYNKCDRLILYWWTSKFDKQFNVHFGCDAFDEIKHKIAQPDTYQEHKMLMFLYLERGYVWVSLGTLPLRIRIILLCSIIKGDMWFSCIISNNIAVSKIWIPQSVVQWFYFNSLWPSDAIRRQGTESTLAQGMTCCLTTPSHYLKQCLLILSKVQWHLSEGNFTKDASVTKWN